MKKLFLCLSMLGMLLTGCSKDDDNEAPGLPPLPDPDDVCSCMDDVVFMQYCYENFDVNKDGKVSKTEANAVTKIDLGYTYNYQDAYDVKTLTGICYFPNLEIINCFHCDRLTSVDLSHNLKITGIQDQAFYDCPLDNIVLPSSIKWIEQKAFSSFSAKVYCAALTPPIIYQDAFPSDGFYTYMKFYVPHESVEAYKAADVWKTYADQIFGYDF